MDDLRAACHELLGIPPSQQPANHYRLLGLALFESHRLVIQNAADCRMAFVRQLASGPYSRVSQALLNLLAEARVCLLDQAKREAYDRTLQRGGATGEPNLEPNLALAATGNVHVNVNAKAKPSHESCGRGATPVEGGRPVAARATVRSGPWSHCSDDSFSGHAPESGDASSDPPAWIIGAGGECDIVVNSPFVSRRHCRLTKIGPRFLLQDLNSRNGTFVNGQWLSEAAVVSPADAICLGSATELSWSLLSRTIDGDASPPAYRIGRAQNNDLVIPDATVSQHHAELRFTDSGVFLVDLDSTNGTYVGRPPRQIARVELSPAETVRFGNFAIPAATLLSR